MRHFNIGWLARRLIPHHLQLRRADVSLQHMAATFLNLDPVKKNYRYNVSRLCIISLTPYQPEDIFLSISLFLPYLQLVAEETRLNETFLHCGLDLVDWSPTTQSLRCSPLRIEATRRTKNCVKNCGVDVFPVVVVSYTGCRELERSRSTPSQPFQPQKLFYSCHVHNATRMFISGRAENECAVAN